MNRYEFEKDIVSFDQAIELCTLGFNEKTMCGYDIADRMLYICQVDEDGLYMPDKDIAAPTNSQVFKWFREKYDFLVIIRDIEIIASDKSGYRWKWIIFRLTEDIYIAEDKSLLGSLTYEEAENACIDKLIELARQQNEN